MTEQELSVEATGETVGEAKWAAVQELQRLAPGLDRDAVFEAGLRMYESPRHDAFSVEQRGRTQRTGK